ncbi:MAG TPA: SHOCT domain-containing protein [Nocardioidaceae bacterium]
MTSDEFGPMRNRRRWEDADEMWDRMHDGVGWGGWLLVLLLLLVLAALVIGAVVWLVTRSAGAGHAGGAAAGGSPGASTAEQVLDERYARGEIEEEEYLRRRSVLRGG